MTASVDVGSLRVVVLAGGRGRRMGALTASVPKPLIEVGGRPLITHILGGYAAAGVRRGVIAAGYRADHIERTFAGNAAIEVVDTGLDTQTGGRLRRLAHHLPEDVFCLTYGDGVSDVDIGALIDFHAAHGLPVTVTAVRPPACFGELLLDGDRVTTFAEKVRTTTGWINGGFMVLHRTVLDMLTGDDSRLEQDLLAPLAEQGRLMAFRHEGFWQCVDTPADLMFLDGLWNGGHPPWTVDHRPSRVLWPLA